MRELRDVERWTAVVAQPAPGRALARRRAARGPDHGHGQDRGPPPQLHGRTATRWRRGSWRWRTRGRAPTRRWVGASPSGMHARHGAARHAARHRARRSRPPSARPGPRPPTVAVEPWYRATLAFDRHRLAEIDAEIRGRGLRARGRRLGHRPGAVLRGRPGPRLLPGRRCASWRWCDRPTRSSPTRRCSRRSLDARGGLARRAARSGPAAASSCPSWRPDDARSHRARRERGDMRVDVNGVGIEYEVTGEGPPVVLLHGFPDSRAAVAPPGARPRRRRVLHHRPRPAGLRRLGPSPTRSRRTPSRTWPATSSAILDAVGVERAHVVGHDWGAALAWAIGSLLPDRVDHLVALSVGHPVGVRVGGLRPAGEVVVHAAVPVRGHRRAVAVRTTTGPTSGPGAATPTSTASSPISRRPSRSPPRSTTTAPTCRPSPSSIRPWSCRRCRPTPWGCGAAATSPSPKRR